MVLFPTLKNEVDFEQMCLEAARLHFNSRNAALYGRKGQNQHGIDIIGNMDEGSQRFAIQCKFFKAEKASFSVLKDKFDADFAAFKAHAPFVDVGLFVFATSAATDGKMQDYINAQQQALREQDSPLKLELWMGKRLSEIIDRYENLQLKYRPNYLQGTHQLTHIPATDPNELVGRNQDLNDLAKQLSQQQQVVLMNGMGGIGKTSLAQAFVYKYGAQYQHLAWITQDDNSPHIGNDMMANRELLNNLNINAEGKDMPTLFSETCNSMANLKSQPNLLIIDNAQANLKKQLKQLPQQPNWHLLITSRHTLPNPGLHHFELGFLKLPHAIALFKKYCQNLSDTEVELLVEEVQLHTLTIEILAKTAAKRRLIYNDLSQALKKNVRAPITTERSKQEKLERITDYLCAIFSLAHLSDDHKWLLKQLACLPADFYTYTDLKDWIQPQASGYDELFAELLTELSEQGWLLFNKAKDTYKMHAIIQSVVQKELAPSVEEVLPMVNYLNALIFENEKKNPIYNFPYVPMAKSLANQFKGSLHERIAVLLSNLALALKHLGELAQAKIYIEKALESDLFNFGEKHPSTAISYSNLAMVLQDLGELGQAKEYLGKALESNLSNFGKKHPNTANAYSNLALVLQDLGDLALAKAYLEKTLQILEDIYSEKHPLIALTQSNLASVLQDLGKLGQAKIYTEKALESDLANFGEKHPTTAIRYSNLALVLQDLGELGQAKIYLEKALQSDLANFGEKHPKAATRYSNLALVLRALGDLEQAKIYLEKALESNLTNLGEKHPKTAIRYMNMGALLVDMQQLPEALDNCEKALSIFKAVLPAGHPHITACEKWVKGIKGLMGDE